MEQFPTVMVVSHKYVRGIKICPRSHKVQSDLIPTPREFYAQGEWWVMSTDTPNLGRDADSTPGARGVYGGGFKLLPQQEQRFNM